MPIFPGWRTKLRAEGQGGSDGTGLVLEGPGTRGSTVCIGLASCPGLQPTLWLSLKGRMEGPGIKWGWEHRQEPGGRHRLSSGPSSEGRVPSCLLPGTQLGEEHRAH